MAGKSLAQATQAAIPPSNGLRMGVVAATPAPTGQKAYVLINGARCGPFVALDSYTPIPGDQVSVLRQDSSWLILGRSSGTTGAGYTAFTGFANGWANSGGTKLVLSYSLRASGLTHIVGFITSPSPFNATIGTLPAGFAGVHDQPIGAGTGTGTGEYVTVSSGGVLTASGDTTVTRIWGINGFLVKNL